MKIGNLLTIALCALILTGCCRNTCEVWDDTKTASRHMKRGFCALGGKHGDSRVVCSVDEFYVADDGYYAYGTDFVPLPDANCNGDVSMAEFVARQPSTTPGDPGSSLPGIEAFKDPSTVPGMDRVFQNVYFEYNSNQVKSQENFDTVRKIADYMRSHPQTYIFVEGHCDERGPEAYNLALGSRRANAVRNMLIEQGVNPDNVFTISYGKERPLVFEHHDEAHAKNRRAEFKIYQR
jgi:peptidoglycan-associated lipoprotein